MTYLASQMVVVLLIAAAFGAVLLWLGQWAFGRLRAPMKWRVLELEVEELKRERGQFHDRITETEARMRAAEENAEQQRRARRQLTATLDARNRAFQELESQLVASERRLRVVETAPPDTPAILRTSITPGDDQSLQDDLLRTQQELRHALITQERLRTEVDVLKDIASSAENELQGLRLQLREAEANAVFPDSRPPAWVMARPNGQKDDLQELEGVDSDVESSLNGLGIFHFHQIARFDENDIEWVAQHVEGVPVGIVRDSWIPVATQRSGLARAH